MSNSTFPHPGPDAAPNLNIPTRAVWHIDEWKPLLRGWIHAVTFPLVSAAGLVLIVLGPTFAARVTSAIYVFTSMLLFSISALYHRFNWTPRVNQVFKRLDHMNIMLIIAGTYTPLAWLLLPRNQAVTLLTLVWGSAVVGILFRVFWVDAPRWLYTPVYVVLGCMAVFYIPEFFQGNFAAAVLVCVGGALYIVGAVIYGLKRPNPSLNWFGFHEVFHTFTVAAFITQFAAVMIAVVNAGPRM